MERHFKRVWVLTQNIDGFQIGATSVFPYIQQPIIEASRLKRPTIEINPDETGVSRLVDIKITLGAGHALDEIWKVYLADI